MFSEILLCPNDNAKPLKPDALVALLRSQLAWQFQFESHADGDWLVCIGKDLDGVIGTRDDGYLDSVMLQVGPKSDAADVDAIVVAFRTLDWDTVDFDEE